MRDVRIELLCVGSELLSGQVNTHQSYLSRRLRDQGLFISREQSLPDDEGEIAEAVRRALDRSRAVLICGGLGPTFDDLTREGVAAALQRGLRFDRKIWDKIRAKFGRYHLKVPDENRRQAFLVEGAKELDNPNGSAPGQLIELGDGRLVAMMPGPFTELSPMFEGLVLPRLRKLRARGLSTASLTVHVSGLTESLVDERLSPVLKLAGAELDFTILAGGGQVDFYAWARAKTPARAKALIAKVRRGVYKAVGANVFGEGAETLESVVGAALSKGRWRLGLAESCTGGMIGARLTAVPGSSKYFVGGVVSYGNGVKMSALGVRALTLSRHGAVSKECAREMAAGARRLSGADVGLAVTGVAGPGGGTAKKPVGLVHVAADGPGKRRAAWVMKIAGGREVVRQRAASAALHHLRRHLEAR